MRKLFLLILPLLVACGRRQGEVVISGKFDNLNQAEFLVYSLDKAMEKAVGKGHQPFDTIHVRNGRFSYRTALTGQATYHIIYPHCAEEVVFANEGDEIELKGDAANLRDVSIKGNDENEAYTRLRARLNAAKGEAQRDSLMQDYIDRHPDARLSRHLQRQLVLKRESPLQVGRSIPPFPFRGDSTTVTITADSLRGHPTLIVVWASWTNMRLHDVRQALCDNDSLHAYTLSADIDYAAHKRILRYDSAFSSKYAPRWHATHNRTGIGDSLINAWRIIDLPYYIWLDSAAVIVKMTK